MPDGAHNSSNTSKCSGTPLQGPLQPSVCPSHPTHSLTLSNSPAENSCLSRASQQAVTMWDLPQPFPPMPGRVLGTQRVLGGIWPMDGQTHGWMSKRSACRVLARNAWACALCYALNPLGGGATSSNLFTMNGSDASFHKSGTGPSTHG